MVRSLRGNVQISQQKEAACASDKRAGFNYPFRGPNRQEERCLVARLRSVKRFFLVDQVLH